MHPDLTSSSRHCMTWLLELGQQTAKASASNSRNLWFIDTFLCSLTLFLLFIWPCLWKHSPLHRSSGIFDHRRDLYYIRVDPLTVSFDSLIMSFISFSFCFFFWCVWQTNIKLSNAVVMYKYCVNVKLMIDCWTSKYLFIFRVSKDFTNQLTFWRFEIGNVLILDMSRSWIWDLALY